MKLMPQVHKFMSVLPHTIGPEASIQAALGAMREHRIRHLPVMRGTDLVGVLTDRDLKLAASFVGAAALKVEDVMTDNPYAVEPEAPIDRVVREMAEHKYGCAVIRQANGKVVGIFTATDGLRVLGEQLGSFYRHPADDVPSRVHS